MRRKKVSSCPPIVGSYLFLLFFLSLSFFRHLFFVSPPFFHHICRALAEIPWELVVYKHTHEQTLLLTCPHTTWDYLRVLTSMDFAEKDKTKKVQKADCGKICSYSSLKKKNAPHWWKFGNIAKDLVLFGTLTCTRRSKILSKAGKWVDDFGNDYDCKGSKSG